MTPAEVDRAERLTKWSILQERERDLEFQLSNLRNEMEWMESATINITCQTCGTANVTEADFARHYTVDDPRYPNLGHCPTRDEGTATNV